MKQSTNKQLQITRTSNYKLDNYKKRKFVEIFGRDEVRGNISLTCDAIDISRQTYYSWLEADEEFRKAIYDVKLRLCDDMEQVLISRAVEKDTIALIFWLKKNHATYKDLPANTNIQVNVTPILGDTPTYVPEDNSDK